MLISSRHIQHLPMNRRRLSLMNHPLYRILQVDASVSARFFRRPIATDTALNVFLTKVLLKE
jgi:hypothetical protein